MFKKMFSTLMVSCLLTATVSASTSNGLKSAYDELNYSLNVEWDQNDKAFYNEHMTEFYASLKELMDQGLTSAEIVNFVQSETKDARIVSDFKATFSAIEANKLTSAEAESFMLQSMNKSYSRGASWNGQATILAGVGVLMVFTIILAFTDKPCGSDCSNGWSFPPYDQLWR